MSAEHSEDAPRGPELARAALEAARAAKRQRGTARGRGNGETNAPRRGGYSSARPDSRDPQLFGQLVNDLVATRGWRAPASEGTVFGAWDRLVGPDIAAHCTPTSLRDGELVVQAESTAWATQLKLLTRTLLAKIAVAVGDQVVKKIRIHGPSGPSWRKGKLSVRGRGPRDTYG